MVRNYNLRTDRATYDEELDKGNYLRDVSNDLHIPKTTLI